MTSYRRIVKSSLITGLSSLVNIIAGIIKTKLLAVMLGASGIGLMGIYQQFVQVMTAFLEMGVNQGGVRQVASAHEDKAAVAMMSKTLLMSAFILGAAGWIILTIFSDEISQILFGDYDHAYEIGLLGMGVLFALVSASQIAVLQGVRDLGRVAQITIWGSVTAAISGVLLVYSLGEAGVLWFVIVAPLFGAVIALYYARLILFECSPGFLRAFWKHWKPLLILGAPLMAAGFVAAAVQLLIRAMLIDEQGLAMAGHYQAAWTISSLYIGFVLGAMAADYLPRLTEVIDNRVEALSVIEEQGDMCLWLSVPVILLVMTLSPWLVELLYTEEFSAATHLLRWFVLGDVIKAFSWSIGFIALAQGRTVLFLVIQLVWNGIFVAIFQWSLASYGLEAAGMAYVVAYLINFIVLYLSARRLIGFTMPLRQALLLLAAFVAGCFIYWLDVTYSDWGLLAGVALTAVFGVYSLKHLADKINVRGAL
ncbi:MAG: O-antigen translocase [Gammaproteobacteria bacterium]|nr:O-antigen translocase [Gammaproteobacteria bacterium]